MAKYSESKMNQFFTATNIIPAKRWVDVLRVQRVAGSSS